MPTEQQEQTIVTIESLEEFRAVFDASPNGVLLVNDEYCITNANPAAECLNDTSRDQLIGRSIFETALVSIDMQEFVHAILTTGKYSWEDSLALSDGTVIVLETICIAHILPNRHLVISHDVTKYKESERTYRQREERLRLALQATNDAILDLDLNSRTRFCTETFVELFGEPPPSMNILQWWRSRIHPDDQQRVSDELSGILDERATFWAAGVSLYAIGWNMGGCPGPYHDRTRFGGQSRSSRLCDVGLD